MTNRGTGILWQGNVAGGHRNLATQRLDFKHRRDFLKSFARNLKTAASGLLTATYAAGVGAYDDNL
jgi:hypothetical protein